MIHDWWKAANPARLLAAFPELDEQSAGIEFVRAEFDNAALFAECVEFEAMHYRVEHDMQVGQYVELVTYEVIGVDWDSMTLYCQLEDVDTFLEFYIGGC